MMLVKQDQLRRFNLICVVLTAAFLSGSCSIIANDKAGIKLVKSLLLSADLGETSGLHCPTDERIYTINDSGNSAVIYQLNSSGDLLHTANVDYPNYDWEALAGDNHHFFIGDIGNNSGKRETINVGVIDKDSFQKVRSLNVVYANNNIAQNEYLKHDYDAEALVSYKDKLILFSKSWLTRKLHVYALNKTEQDQIIAPITSVEGLPGLVTGADYDAVKNQFVLVGYSVNSFWIFSPFIAILNEDFSLVASYRLPGFAQVEGVCISASGKIWISQEGSLFSGPKLANILIQ